MLDYFKILGQPRRPWLAPDILKERFQRLSASCHPDVAQTSSGADFAAINKAWQVLREPSSRLRHLLELEYPAGLASARALPPALIELFAGIGKAQEELNEFLASESRAASALEKALLASAKFALLDRLEKWNETLNLRYAALENELRELDDAWDRSTEPAGSSPGIPERYGERLSALQQEFTYIGKWSAQLGEDIVKLSL